MSVNVVDDDEIVEVDDVDVECLEDALKVRRRMGFILDDDDDDDDDDNDSDDFSYSEV